MSKSTKKNVQPSSSSSEPEISSEESLSSAETSSSSEAPVPPKKVVEKKTPAKKAPVNKTPAKEEEKKTPVKKAPAKEEGKKAPVKKTPAKEEEKKTPAKKAPAKEAEKKTPAKKAPAKAPSKPSEKKEETSSDEGGRVFVLDFASLVTKNGNKPTEKALGSLEHKGKNPGTVGKSIFVTKLIPLFGNKDGTGAFSFAIKEGDKIFAYDGERVLKEGVEFEEGKKLAASQYVVTFKSQNPRKTE